MPKLPPRPCTAPRCHDIATKDGRCDKHKREAWQTSKGKTPAQRGYGIQWRKRRNRIMKRDSHLCQECKRNGIITQAKEVDHIINKARGGTDDDSNLEAICTPCHKAKTVRERNAG